ncbi:hypothetical protein M409DRAFT_17073 [Zasmidium cellare ATCC 36951]|uniref:RRM domain-containing protein n=1 Tax=Zasmidium cellare ATCC 36951 TaxID=1080233 RepID=A0A6A6D1R7_ZASCE|nr:uncharacterized protein M409DRAFT_17073 [Zasmidium cellare ATCC 36951]KAF2173125.1 hypothetical protein M409DRAFT_17073 [Zasmidium cellare ATCC 36951]
MALPQPLEPDDLREPVIVSTNRADDVGPYMNNLFAEDPKKWMNVMPWEFPQNDGKEAEEQFLRTFFTDREIRKQGGAAPPGNGYRFLKQVWMSCALWNVNYRIPAIVDKWLWQNQDLVKDPSMTQHFFSEDVQPSTFFAPDELEEYGPKLLHWAVKGIQGYMRIEQAKQTDQANQADQSNQQDQAPVQAAAEGAAVATSARPSEQEPIKKTEEPPVKHHDPSSAFFKKPRNPNKPTFSQLRKEADDAARQARATKAANYDTATATASKKTATAPAGKDTTAAPAAEATTTAPAGEATATAPVGEAAATAPTGEDVATTSAGKDMTTAPEGEGTTATATVTDEDTTTTATPAVGVIPLAPASAETGPPAVIPAATGHAQGSQTRNFSSGSHHLVEERQQSFRRGRGNQGNKRNSFNGSRPPPRPQPAYGDPRHASNPYSPYGGPPAQMSPMPPGSAPVMHRMPSGGAFPSPVGPMPTLPKGQQFYGPPAVPGYQMGQPMQQPYDPSMHHMQPQQQMFMQGPPPGPYQYNAAPSAYNMQPAPFADRSNVHLNTTHYNNEQPFYPMENQANYRNQRHDSTYSRTSKGRGGFGGSMRGRGNRGRGSFSNEGQFMPRNAPNDASAAPFPQHERNFSMEREGHQRRQDWQGRGQADNTFAQGGNNYQACTVGCTKFQISDICTTATKLILFNVTPTIHASEVQHFFSQFGPVRWVSEPKKATSAPAPGMPPRWYMWVTFEDVSGARKCLASKGLQWPGGTLLPEVAKDHWDPPHMGYFRSGPGYQRPSISYGAPTTGMPMPAPDVQGTPAQPQTAPVQEPPVPEPPVQEPPVRRDSQSGYSTPIATDSSATPTASRDNTPKNKKSQKKKGNKKRAEQKEDTSSEKAGEVQNAKDDAAHKETDKPDPLPSPSDEDAEVKKSEAIETASSEASPSAAEEVEVKVADDAGPKASGDEDKTPTITAAEPVLASEEEKSVPVEPVESDSTAEKATPPIKQDEDVNDESFHTASGSPEVEKDVTLEGADATTPTIPTAPEQENTQEGNASASVSDVGSAHSNESVPGKSSAKSPSPGKDAKKAPIPQVPSQKNVTIAVTPVDTEKAEAFGKAQTEFLQVPQQRSTSGSSDATTAAFVTAPSTPAIPEPTQEPRSKKPPKEKGPDQTESLSIFGKTSKRKASSKAKDKKSAGKRKGSSAVPETSTDTKPTAKSEESTAIPEEPEKADIKQEDPSAQPVEHEQKQDITKVADPVIIEPSDSKPDETTAAEAGGDDGSKPKMSAKAAGKQPVGRSEESTTSVSDDITAQSEEKTEVGEQEPEDGEAQDEGKIGLGISHDTNPETSKPKKKKKTKPKNKKKPAQAQVTVTEMSHPGIDNHTSKSTYEFKGNDLGPKDASQEAQEPKPSNANAHQPSANANLPNSSTMPNDQNVQATDDGRSPSKSLAQRLNERQPFSSQENPSNFSYRTRSMAGSDTQRTITIVDRNGNGNGQVSPDDEVEVTYIVWALDDDDDTQAPDGDDNLTAAAEAPAEAPHEEVSPGVTQSINYLAELTAQENRGKEAKAKKTELEGTQTETQ